ncbi:MAG: hypothetical protein CL927_15760 [Deltaproteobacteria bacterium]|nr:hypothetical protein [Deltaproteobacteria bacterium]HCH62504.1 hypothetical protein [Deltaproteobacteria bacterium]
MRAADLLVVLLLTVVGAVVGSQVAGHFRMPVPIDRDLWHVVSPGLDERIQDPALGRGVYIEDGALTLRQHAFHRAEILTPKDTAAVSSVRLDLTKGTLRVNFPGPTGITFATLSPDQAQNPADTTQALRRPEGAPWVLNVQGPSVVLQTTEGAIPLGDASGGGVELTALSEEVRIGSIEVLGTNGQAVLVDDFAARAEPLLHWLWGALGGLLFGLFARVATRGKATALGWVEAGLLAVPPLAVCLVAPADWLYLVERAYLVRTPAWGLARGLLFLSLAPTIGLALLRSGVLTPPRPATTADGRPFWLAAALLAAVAGWAHSGFSTPGAVISVLGLGFLLMPMRIARDAELHPLGALIVDGPAHLCVFALGWGTGLLGAIGWRLLTIVAAAGDGRLRKAPRPTTDLLFVMVLLTPVSLELSVRSSYLEEGWDLARLSGDLAPSVGWQNPAPFWTGDCGNPAAPPDRTLRILWMGGSSTGGAYQFRDQPTAFYPAQTHQRLCDRLPEDVRLVSENFGDGGRDTFTISRSLADIASRAPISLVVVYTGVNDLLTMSGTKTRAQREAIQAERDATTSTLARLSAQSRLLTGIGLFLRPLHSTDGARVPEVPLADSEVNFETISSVAASHDAQVLLLTEVIRTEGIDPLAPYTALEARTAQRLDPVHFFDLRAAVLAQGEWDDHTMLVDQNHLSRSGSARVGAALAPAVARVLGVPEPTTTDLAPIPATRFGRSIGHGSRP